MLFVIDVQILTVERHILLLSLGSGYSYYLTLFLSSLLSIGYVLTLVALSFLSFLFVE